MHKLLVKLSLTAKNWEISLSFQFEQNVMEAMDKLADNMGADLKCGDPAREAHDSRLGSVKVQVSKLDTQIVSSSMSGAPKFDAGPALSGQYSAPRQCGGGKICCGVFLKLIHYKEKVIVADESKQDDAIDVIDSQVRINQIQLLQMQLQLQLC